MNCKEVKKNFIGLISGEINEKIQKDIEKHISRCESCRKEMESVKKFNMIISQAKAPVQTEQFWNLYPDEVMEKINMIPHNLIKPVKKRFELSLFIRKPAYAFAFAAVLTIGFLSYYEWNSENEQMAVNYSNSLEFIIDEYNAVASENVLMEDLTFEKEILY